MVDSVKNYGLAGVGGNVELGKGGSRIVSSSDKVSLYNNAQDTLITANIANGTLASHAVTNAQLDSIQDSKVSVLTTTVNYNSGNVSLGNIKAGSTVLSVTVEKTAGNWTGYDSSTNITVGDAGDTDRLFTAFDPAGAQVTDETNHEYASQTELFAYVTAGNASAGSAKVSLFYSGSFV